MILAVLARLERWAKTLQIMADNIADSIRRLENERQGGRS